MYHTPVLAELSVRLLLTNPCGIYVDATLGGGGHSRRILEQLAPEGRVIGIDQDREAIALCEQSFSGESRMTIVYENFSRIASVLDRMGIEAVDGILMDLGVSSHQLDEAERGFSFQAAGPLDMRMDTRLVRSAAEFINSAEQSEIEDVIRKYGEERHYKRIAKAIVDARNENALTTTEQFRSAITRAVLPPHLHKTLARVFQAVRIAVNDELAVLQDALESTYSRVKPAGRYVVISYHSLEDRIVKQFFRDIVTADPMNLYRSTSVESRFKLLTKKTIIPDEDEIQRNPRARSARLRAAEKR